MLKPEPRQQRHHNYAGHHDHYYKRFADEHRMNPRFDDPRFQQGHRGGFAGGFGGHMASEFDDLFSQLMGGSFKGQLPPPPQQDQSPWNMFSGGSNVSTSFQNYSRSTTNRSDGSCEEKKSWMDREGNRIVQTKLRNADGEESKSTVKYFPDGRVERDCGNPRDMVYNRNPSAVTKALYDNSALKSLVKPLFRSEIFNYDVKKTDEKAAAALPVEDKRRVNIGLSLKGIERKLRELFYVD